MLWNFIWSILIGGAAGYLAGQLTRGSGFGCWLNIVIGILGSVLGCFIFELIGLQSTGVIGSLIMSTLGALLLLWIISKIKLK